jgi:CheY-like chemotaxis protein
MTRVLVVDDSATDRRLAGGLLEKQAGWEVYFAANGKEALDAFEMHVPDIVVTDLDMPEMNGLELVEEVNREYPLIPIVLMTAKGSEEIAVQALELGAASYVPKSQLARKLVDTAVRVWEMSREHGTLHRVLNRMTEVAFSVENDLKLVSALTAHLRQIIEGRTIFDQSDCLRVGTALDEAFQNAYFHGNLEVSSELREQDDAEYYNLADTRKQQEPYRSRRIHVRAQFTPMDVTITIRDDGPGFDPQEVPDPTDPEMLERASGRGMLLMRTFMDSIEYNESGNEVTMIKRRVIGDAELATARGERGA